MGRNSEQKMMQRSALFQILNKYDETIDINPEELRADIEKIKIFQDQEYVCNLLFKEITNTNKKLSLNYINRCALYALEAISADIFEKQAYEIMSDKSVDDEKKFFIISLLKQKGLSFDYTTINDYIKSPEQLAKAGVKNFLVNAIDNAETQVDLLDFYQNISEEERFALLNNLIEEYKGDDLANAFSILVQLPLAKEEFKIVINELLETSSPYSLEGLNFLIKNRKLPLKYQSRIRTTIAKIEKENPKFKSNSLIANSKLHSCQIGFVDGDSCFSMVITRILKNSNYNIALFGANISEGIVSCMGFEEVTEEMREKIITRLFSDSIPVDIDPVSLKAIFYHYLDKNYKQNTEPPYETIVWKKMFSDINDSPIGASEIINSDLKKIELNFKKVKKFASAKVVETWYYPHGSNETLDKLIEEIETKHITNLEKYDEIATQLMNTTWLKDEEFLSDFQSRLLLQAYISKLAGFSATSGVAYALCFKNPYLKILLSSILDKSVYYYLSNRYMEYEEEYKDKFSKKLETSFTKDELYSLMSALEAKWQV